MNCGSAFLAVSRSMLLVSESLVELFCLSEAETDCEMCYSCVIVCGCVVVCWDNGRIWCCGDMCWCLCVTWCVVLVKAYSVWWCVLVCGCGVACNNGKICCCVDVCWCVGVTWRVAIVEYLDRMCWRGFCLGMGGTDKLVLYTGQHFYRFKNLYNNIT
jgi:hypothetical protein